MRRTLLLLPLALSLFACAFVEDFITLEGPEDLATDAFGTVAPPTSPAVTEPPIAGGATPTPPDSQTPTPGLDPDPTLVPLPDELPFTLDQADDATLALRADFAADVELFPDASRYVIDVAVTFEPDGSATLTGRALIRYTNRETFPLDDMVLMLWPNEPSQYLGRMTLDSVLVAGQPVEPALENRDLLARLPLAEPLQPGGVIELEARFTTQVNPGLENGARFGMTNGLVIAPTFYPLIPRIVNGVWQTLPDGFPGDTANSDSAFYAWRVTAPDGLAIVGSGSPIDVNRSGSLQSQTLVTGPMRDLALVVGELEQSDNNAAGVDVNAYLLPEHADESGQVLAQAGTQMSTLSTLVGPYPYNQLDIVDVPGAYGGVEYPGIIFIGVIEEGSGGYESAVVHEVGHQWFYGLIGDDQLLEPWLDEAAASYTEVLYAEAIGGPDAYADYIDFFRQYLDFAGDPTLPIGLPSADYPGGDYYSIVYGKGPLFFDALRRQLGDDTFFAFLQAYYAEYRYGFATSQGFQATAEATCACDLDALFNLWVYEGGPVE